MLATLT